MEKYTLNYTKDNHILSIAHTAADDVELDLSTVDTDHLGAYQYIDGALVLDEDMLAEMMAAEKKAENDVEIARLKAELASTDYEAIKYSEGWFTDEEYAPIKAKREELREKIRLLEV